MAFFDDLERDLSRAGEHMPRLLEIIEHCMTALAEVPRTGKPDPYELDLVRTELRARMILGRWHQLGGDQITPATREIVETMEAAGLTVSVNCEGETVTVQAIDGDKRFIVRDMMLYPALVELAQQTGFDVDETD